MNVNRFFALSFRWRRLLGIVLLMLAMPRPAAAAAAFQHPGIINNRAQLDFIKGKIKSGAQPWKAAFDNMNASSYASLTYAPRPRASVNCGSFSKPDLGCSDEKRDVAAAYTHALLWYFTGKEEYAKKSIEIMNAWSAVLKGHTLSNAPLQAAWCATQFPRAADIIKATYPKWPAAKADRFSSMLKNVYLPMVINGSGSNGNWELSMIEASMDIGVFLDDRTVFDKSTAMWRARVPAYFYLKRDGAMPLPPPLGNHAGNASLVQYWYGQTRFENGLAQETCRDFGHTQYGLASTLNAAETAYLQGVDLYGEQAERLEAAMEFHADYILGKAAPSWLCGGKLSVTLDPTWEIGYNHYHNRMGAEMPFSKSLILTKLRPTGVDHMMAWETLTHAELGEQGTSGIKPAGSSGMQLPTGPAEVRFGKAGAIEVIWKNSLQGSASAYTLMGAKVADR